MDFTTILAFLQTSYEMVLRWANHVRMYYVLPLMQTGGYDMVLLKNGQWLPQTSNIPESEITMTYSAAAHAIRIPRSNAALKRWEWLSVTAEGRDLSDFFSGLRITTGATLATPQIMMLFAHQKGWFPLNELSVVMRDGTEHKIAVFSSIQPVLTNNQINQLNNYINTENDINYIR